MEEKTFIESEDKTAKTGKAYTRFKDNTGIWFSCFEAEITKKIQEHFNQRVMVELAITDKFKNIRGFDRVLDNNAPHIEKVIPQAVETIQPQAVKKPSKYQDNERMASILLAYAKDLACANNAPLVDFTKVVYAEYEKLKTQLENE